MNKDVNLSPFDFDAVGMVRQITGIEPSVDRIDEKSFCINWELRKEYDKFDLFHEAITEALKGRFGKRYVNTDVVSFTKKAGFAVCESITTISYDGQEWPTEDVYEIEPNINAGIIFTPKLRQFRAIQLTPENINNVAKFTGGGKLINYTNTTTPENTYYEFETENGTFIKVLPGDFIACENDHYFMIPQKDIDNYFEPKYSN